MARTIRKAPCCGRLLISDAAVQCSDCKQWVHKDCHEKDFSCKQCKNGAENEVHDNEKIDENEQGVSKESDEFGCLVDIDRGKKNEILSKVLSLMEQSRLAQESFCLKLEENKEQDNLKWERLYEQMEQNRLERRQEEEKDRLLQEDLYRKLEQKEEQNKLELKEIINASMQKINDKMEEKLGVLEVQVTRIEKMEDVMKEDKVSCQFQTGINEVKYDCNKVRDNSEKIEDSSDQLLVAIESKQRETDWKVHVLEERVCVLGMKNQQVEDESLGIQQSQEVISKEESFHEKPEKNDMFPELKECVTLDVTVPEMTLISRRKRSKMRLRYISVKKKKKTKRKKLKSAKKVEKASMKVKKKVRKTSKNVSAERSDTSMKKMKQEKRAMHSSDEGERKSQKKRDRIEWKKVKKKVASDDSHSEENILMDNKKRKEKILRKRDNTNSFDRLIVSLLHESWKKKMKNEKQREGKKKKNRKKRHDSYDEQGSLEVKITTKTYNSRRDILSSRLIMMFS